MGKTQSKRSVDITTEAKKGTEEEITEKMEKIEDLDKKEISNGDATISEKIESEKNDADVENDKDMTTEKDVDEQTNGDGAETQTVAETTKDERGSEEISPLADESVKKSKKEKVKKKWSFRSISFGKKDKIKPAKNEDAAEDGSAAINGSDADEKTIKDPEDTPKEKSANENEEKTNESYENGNSSPRKLNGGEQNDKKPSDEKTNDITANTTNNTNNTEKFEPVQNEIAAVISELSDKTESTVVINENKISEIATVDDTSKNGNGIDDNINATYQEPLNKDVTHTSAEYQSDKTTNLASAVTNESSITTNGELIDKIHQNGDHGESEQEFVEKSKAQIEVNFNTDNKVSAATLHSISSNSITPYNVQIHAQDLNTSSEKPDEIIQIDNDESVIKNSTVTEINSSCVDQSSLSEIVSMVDVKNNLEIGAAFDFISEVIDNEEKLGVDPSPPPLPISPPPSQVSAFAFTSNDESVEDSLQAKYTEPTINNVNMEENKEMFPLTKKLEVNCQQTGTISIEKIDERKTSKLDQVKNFEIQCQENEVGDEASIYNKDLNKDNAVPSCDRLEESQIEEEASVAVAAAVIDEIAELAAEIVNQQLKSNEEPKTDKQFCEKDEKKEDKVNNKNIYVECTNDKSQNNEDYANEQEYVVQVINNLNESVTVIDQSNNDSIECYLGFTTSDSKQQDYHETNFLKKSDNLEENHLDPSKECGTAKDIKDNVTIAEITQDLSVTCE